MLFLKHMHEEINELKRIWKWLCGPRNTDIENLYSYTADFDCSKYHCPGELLYNRESYRDCAPARVGDAKEEQ